MEAINSTLNKFRENEKALNEEKRSKLIGELSAIKNELNTKINELNEEQKKHTKQRFDEVNRSAKNVNDNQIKELSTKIGPIYNEECVATKALEEQMTSTIIANRLNMRKEFCDILTSSSVNLFRSYDPEYQIKEAIDRSLNEFLANLNETIEKQKRKEEETDDSIRRKEAENRASLKINLIRRLDDLFLEERTKEKDLQQKYSSKLKEEKQRNKQSGIEEIEDFFERLKNKEKDFAESGMSRNAFEKDKKLSGFMTTMQGLQEFFFKKDAEIEGKLIYKLVYDEEQLKMARNQKLIDQMLAFENREHKVLDNINKSKVDIEVIKKYEPWIESLKVKIKTVVDKHDAEIRKELDLALKSYFDEVSVLLKSIGFSFTFPAGLTQSPASSTSTAGRVAHKKADEKKSPK